MNTPTRTPAGTPTGGQFATSAKTESDVALDAHPAPYDGRPEPTPDQSYCDLGMHQQCSGYTEDEGDPESCFCDCHDLEFS